MDEDGVSAGPVIRIRPEAASTIAVISDASVSDEGWSAAAAGSRVELEALAKQGSLFFVASDDPVFHRIDVFVDEPIPEDLDALFTGRSGQFLLRVPTGRVVVTTYGASDASHGQAFELPAGNYVVAVRDRVQPDVQAHERTIEQLVGPDDWRFCQRIDRFGAIGCVTLAASLLLLLVPLVRRQLWFVPAALALPFAANLVLTRLPRYRRVKKLQAEYTISLPVYLLTLHRVTATDGLSGGWYTD